MEDSGGCGRSNDDYQDGQTRGGQKRGAEGTTSESKRSRCVHNIVNGRTQELYTKIHQRIQENTQQINSAQKHYRVSEYTSARLQRSEGSSTRSYSSPHNSIINQEMKGLKTMDEIFPITADGIETEWINLTMTPLTGSTDAASLAENSSKNFAYSGECYDHTRVKLKSGNDPVTDYINANFIDGFIKENGYICTQVPTPSTCNDFWKMVWDQNSRVIVQIPSLDEREEHLVGDFLPSEAKKLLVLGDIEVQHLYTRSDGHIRVTSVQIYESIRHKITKKIYHLTILFKSHGNIPSTVYGILNLLTEARHYQILGILDIGSKEWKGHYLDPPMVVMCNQGTALSGMFICLDICVAMLERIKKVNIEKVAAKIRTQRGLLLGNFEQYLFVYLALVEYAKLLGLINDCFVSGI